MQLTDRSDLGLRILLYLAVHEDVRVSVSAIAQAYGISEAHLAKVSQALARAGFIETMTGRNGGIRLARPADAIRVGEVVRALEQTTLVECFAPGGSCAVTNVCGLQHALHEALEAFLEVLDGVTLAEAAGRRTALRRRLSRTPSPPRRVAP